MRFLWFSVLVICGFAACNEVEDTERPEVEIESPMGNSVVFTNDGLRLIATVTDNSGLLQYKLIVNGIDSLNDIGADSTFSVIYIDGLPNVQTYLLDHVIGISDSTFNGFYYAVLTCLDVEGNESIRDTVRFEIKNSIDSIPPVFNVQGPEPNDTLGFGQGFVVSGNVNDSRSLIYSEFFVGRQNFSDTIHSFKFSAIQNNMVDYDGLGWYFPVDSTWSQGAYHVYYTAWDNYSGVSHSIPFYVKY